MHAAPDRDDDDHPVPLSFPAILRNPKLSDRFAHLHVVSDDAHRIKKDRPEPEGKRSVRRRENAKFAHNPHVALPSTADLVHPIQTPLSTFPHPLPAYLPRSLLLPPSSPPSPVESSSTAGLFSLSLRGVRRTLRARPAAPHLVTAIESHLVSWLQGGTYLNPDQSKGLLCFPGDPVGGREDIRELARDAAQLVWAVGPVPDLASPAHADGGFERYVVHCVARWYGVVSFSRDIDGHRLTYLLRPNVTRPDPRASAAPSLDTPPATDASDFHVSDAGLSDVNNTTDDSDADSVAPRPASLSDIEESRPSSPASWSLLGGSDVDSDDRGFAASMESLSLSAHASECDGADTTLTPSRLPDAARAGSPSDGEPLPRARADRDRLRTLYPRSASSPSPARRSPHRFHTPRKVGARRRKAKNDNKVFAGASKGTFYDYLFS